MCVHICESVPLTQQKKKNHIHVNTYYQNSFIMKHNLVYFTQNLFHQLFSLFYIYLTYRINKIIKFTHASFKHFNLIGYLCNLIFQTFLAGKRA